MKDLGVFSGSLELDTSKLKDQLKAIEMAAGALAHNLNEIDALYEEGEKGTYTKTMAKPEAFEDKRTLNDNETTGKVKHHNLVSLVSELRDKDCISIEAFAVLNKVIEEHKEYTERSGDK
jgi:hypothetical protein